MVGHIRRRIRMTLLFSFLRHIPNGRVPVPRAALQEWAEQLGQLNAYLKSEMFYGQALQAEQADEDRLPAPVYHEGDEVWLLRRHIQTTRPWISNVSEDLIS